MTGGDSGNGEKWTDSGENFESGVPTGLGMEVSGFVGHPQCLLASLPASGSPTPFPTKVCGVAMAVLELLRRAVFQKALSAS